MPNAEAAGRDLKTAQIGASDVLLIQYRLLKRGIESAPMTTDDGIDLVVYAPALEKAVTVQVKTNLRPKPAGGRGAPAVDWWLPEDSPADLVGLVNLAHDEAWLLTHEEFEQRAQQRSGGRLHLFFYVDRTFNARPGCGVVDFDHFRLEQRLADFFHVPR